MIDRSKINSRLWKTTKDKINQFNVICSFLDYLNRSTSDFVLKGGTSLMVCYGLERFSEGIYLDSVNKNAEKYIKEFCMMKKIEYRKAKNTETEKRFLIRYGKDNKPLKVEISYRQKCIDKNKIESINGVLAYKINDLFGMKMNAYNNRDKIRDLYDIVFIIKNYEKQISFERLDMFKDILSYKGIEQFDYLIKNQSDELIDNEKLASDFLEVFDSLGLLDDYKMKEEIKNVDDLSKSIYNQDKELDDDFDLER